MKTDQSFSGWVSAHRSLLTWEWFSAPNHFHIFMYLIMKANHAPARWRGHDVARGEVLTSLANMEAATGVSKQRIRTVLKNLKKSGEIELLTNTQLTHISICNYDAYQKSDTPTNTRTNTQPTQSQHGANTDLTTNNKNNNNNKNNKKNKLEKKFCEMTIDLPENINRQTWVDFMQIRRKNKAQNTERAINLLLAKLKSSGEDPNKIIEDSIVNNWKGVFPKGEHKIAAGTITTATISEEEEARGKARFNQLFEGA